MRKALVDELTAASDAPGIGLAPAALVIARIEYPRLEPEPYLTTLDRMGDDARRWVERRVDETGDPSTVARIQSFNTYLFDEQRFVGNRDHYEDPRNSCLNEVLERRTGIPITLSVVYLEVGRRAGLHVDGVNFPGRLQDGRFQSRGRVDDGRRRGVRVRRNPHEDGISGTRPPQAGRPERETAGHHGFESCQSRGGRPDAPARRAVVARNPRGTAEPKPRHHGRDAKPPGT